MLCRDSGEHARFCRIGCLVGMHAYALAGMVTHGSANPVVLPPRLPRSHVISGRKADRVWTYLDWSATACVGRPGLIGLVKPVCLSGILPGDMTGEFRPLNSSIRP
jgi:hypothetical protein